MQASWLKNVAMAVVGTAIGGAFLWLAFRTVEFEEVRALAATISGSLLASAVMLYWVAIILRVFRWQLLLRSIGEAPLLPVGETLVVGYAVNNVLPARLGEVVRAAYAKRRLQIGRARTLGSIVVERFLDLGAILSCLVCGLAMMQAMPGATRLPTFELIALNAGAVIGALVLMIVIIRSGRLEKIPLPAPVLHVLSEFCAGLGSLRKHSLLLVLLLTAGVWCFEVLALARVFSAIDISLSVPQALLIMGAASLSTLVPTAPGYLGTYQLVFVLAMASFGYDDSAGIVTSSAIQLALFGSVTLAGGLILIVRSMRKLHHAGLSHNSAVSS